MEHLPPPQPARCRGGQLKRTASCNNSPNRTYVRCHSLGQMMCVGSVVLSVAFAFGVIGRQLVKDVDMEQVDAPQPARL